MKLHIIAYFGFLGLAMAAGFYSWKKLSKPLKLFALLMGYTLAHELLVRGCEAKTTVPLYTAYAGMSSLVYLNFTASFTSMNSHRWVIRIVLMPAVIISAIVSYCYGEGFPSPLVAVTHLFIILGSLVLLIDILLHDFHTNLWRDSVFVLSVAVFIYHSVGLVYLGAYDYLRRMRVEFTGLMYLHIGMSLLYYGVIAASFFRFTTKMNAHSFGE